MSADETTRYQVNFKTPSGTLINLYAASDFELKDQLRSLTEHLAPDIVAAETALGAVSNVVHTPPASQQQQQSGVRVSAASSPSPDQQGSYSQASPVAQQGGAPAPSCIHGQRVFRSGTSKKTGKPYSGWYCPADQCSVEWK